MKIQYMVCPRCGGEVQAPDLNRVNYCAYCGSPIYIDDEAAHAEKTTIFRDEARLKEAENEARRLDLEEERLGQEKKIIIYVTGIVLLFALGIVYLVSPVDLLSGIIIDDVLVVYLCVKAIFWIGHRMKK